MYNESLCGMTEETKASIRLVVARNTALLLH